MYSCHCHCHCHSWTLFLDEASNMAPTHGAFDFAGHLGLGILLLTTQVACKEGGMDSQDFAGRWGRIMQ
jgi:hypothetical protein